MENLGLVAEDKKKVTKIIEALTKHKAHGSLNKAHGRCFVKAFVNVGNMPTKVLMSTWLRYVSLSRPAATAQTTASVKFYVTKLLRVSKMKMPLKSCQDRKNYPWSKSFRSAVRMNQHKTSARKSKDPGQR